MSSSGILASVRTHILPWLWARQRPLLILFVGVLIPLWVFGALAEDVLEHEAIGFDRPVLLFFHHHATPLLDRFNLFWSLVGGGEGLIPINAVVLSVLLWRRRWGDFLFWSLANGGSFLLNRAAKQLFGRVRPELWASIAPEGSLSFPSGHAMGTMALAASIVVLAWPTRWRWPAFVSGSLFVPFVGLSRVYLGVHYPSDILAGWAATFLWVTGVSVVLYGRGTKPTPQAEPSEPAEPAEPA